MSHFYGTLQGARGRATRCGTRTSGVRVEAAGWQGAIEVHVFADEETGEDRYYVRLIPWRHGGTPRTLAAGILDATVTP